VNEQLPIPPFNFLVNKSKQRLALFRPDTERCARQDIVYEWFWFCDQEIVSLPMNGDVRESTCQLIPAVFQGKRNWFGMVSGLRAMEPG